MVAGYTPLVTCRKRTTMEKVISGVMKTILSWPNFRKTACASWRLPVAYGSLDGWHGCFSL